MAVSLARRSARRLIRLCLDPLLSWRQLENPASGYSILLGVPWDLRHLLPVNLQFVARTDLSNLHRLYVVFDRSERPGAEDLMSHVRKLFPQLPVEFLFHPRAAGRIVETVNVSTYYNSLNCATALSRCETRYLILHDFDLYPLVTNYFAEVHEGLRKRELHFAGLEHTPFDGLIPEDNLLGTWCLGMDAQWIRNNFRPIHVFQRIARIRGRLVQLDPFNYLQTLTPKRQLVGTIDGSSCCHVKNLCGTYIRYKTGRKPDFVWRLHYLWYLEYVNGAAERLNEVTDAMERADSGMLHVGGYCVDFSRTHITCANVLRRELQRMDEALYGACRAEVGRYASCFEQFLLDHGDLTPVETFQKVMN